LGGGFGFLMEADGGVQALTQVLGGGDRRRGRMEEEEGGEEGDDGSDGVVLTVSHMSP